MSNRKMSFRSIWVSLLIILWSSSPLVSSYAEDQDLKLYDYFGTIVVINIENRQDRLSEITENLKKVGVNEFEIFKAIDGRKNVSETLWNKMGLNWAGLDLSKEEGRAQFERQRRGETGCYLSHYYVIKQINTRFEKAKEDLALAKSKNDPKLIEEAQKSLKKSSSVLILEDDNGFGIVGPDYTSATLVGVKELFKKAMEELPKDYDMFYFMTYAHPGRENKPYSPHLAKVLGGYTANAYALNHTVYDKLEKVLAKIFLPEVLSVEPVDNVFASLHPTMNCFAIVPSIAYQSPGMSVINGTTNNYLFQQQPLKNPFQ